LVRKGDVIEYRDLQSREDVISAYKYANRLVSDDPPADSIEKARPQLRPAVDFLKGIAAQYHTNKMVLIEDGNFELASITKLYSDADSLQLMRDIADVSVSVNHFAKSILPTLGQSAVLLTAKLGPLNDSRLLGSRERLYQLEGNAFSIRDGTSWSDFTDILEGEDATQITLIVRTAGAGLVFSDRWVSFDEIKDAITDAKTKDLIHIVTNGDIRVEDMFAESKKFNRVVLSRFKSGDLDTFSSALDNVLAYYTAWSLPVITMTTTEFDNHIAAADVFTKALTDVAESDGASTRIDVRKLVARLHETDPENASQLLAANSAWLSAHSQAKAGIDISTAIDSARVRTISNEAARARKAAAELSAFPVTKGE
jgi:hypothetical protein